MARVCRGKENVACKMRRYEKLDVASELVSDVLGFIRAIIDTSSMNNRLIPLRLFVAFLPTANYDLSSGGCS